MLFLLRDDDTSKENVHATCSSRKQILPRRKRLHGPDSDEDPSNGQCRLVIGNTSSRTQDNAQHIGEIRLESCPCLVRGWCASSDRYFLRLS